jgi:hypothetical protein
MCVRPGRNAVGVVVYLIFKRSPRTFVCGPHTRSLDIRSPEDKYSIKKIKTKKKTNRLKTFTVRGNLLKSPVSRYHHRSSLVSTRKRCLPKLDSIATDKRTRMSCVQQRYSDHATISGGSVLGAAPAAVVSVRTRIQCAIFTRADL